MTLAIGKVNQNWRYDPVEEQYVPELIDGITLSGEMHVVAAMPDITYLGSNAKYGFRLNELPLKELPSSVMIKKISAPLSTWTEVQISAGQYVAAGEFFVDYHKNLNSNTGIVLLPASELGEAFYVTYKGLGSVSSAENLASQIWPVGSIITRGSSTPPAGFVPCDGAAISRTSYATLFAEIGTVFGIGDGSTTFNVPDLQGRTAIGEGTGTGLSLRTLGDILGEEDHVLLTAELAAHAHGVNDPSHGHTLANLGYSKLPTSTVNPQDIMRDGPFGGTKGVNGAYTGISIQAEGADAPHNTMQPSLVMAFFIKY